jgi:thiol-disulfide isomerase/thioredoxin
MRYLEHVSILFHSLAIALLLGGCTASSAAPVRKGDIAPVLAATTLAGDPAQVGPQPGQMLWLNFWASWCHPCQNEWPGLNQAQQNLARYRLRLVAVSVNERPDKVQAFLDRHPAAFTIALDPHGELAARYSVVGFPTHVLVDQAGVVRAIVRGPLDERRARKLLGLTDSGQGN